jgi:hypothetical protein
LSQSVYLDRDLQRQARNTLAYAFVPGGCLFLGSAEGAKSSLNSIHVIGRFPAEAFELGERGSDVSEARGVGPHAQAAVVDEAGEHIPTLEAYAREDAPGSAVGARRTRSSQRSTLVFDADGETRTRRPDHGAAVNIPSYSVGY